MDMECFDTPSKKRGRKRKFVQQDQYDDSSSPSSLSPPSTSMDSTKPFYEQISTPQSPAKIPRRSYDTPMYSHQPYDSQPPPPAPAMPLQQMSAHSQVYQQQHPTTNFFEPAKDRFHELIMYRTYASRHTAAEAQPHTMPRYQHPSYVPPSPTGYPGDLNPMQQQQQQIVQSMQLVTTELQVKKELLQSMLVTGLAFDESQDIECSPSSKQVSRGSYVYKNLLLGDDSFGVFWDLLEQFVSNKQNETPEQKAKALHLAERMRLAHTIKGGVCFAHTECVKQFIFDVIQDHLRLKAQQKAAAASNTKVLSVRSLLCEGSTQVPPTEFFFSNMFAQESQQQQQQGQQQQQTAAVLLETAPQQPQQQAEPNVEEMYIQQTIDYSQQALLVHMLDDGRIILWNKKAYELLGFDKNEISKHNMTWLDVLDTATLPHNWLQMVNNFTNVKPCPSSNTFSVEGHNLLVRNQRTGQIMQATTHTTGFLNRQYAVVRFSAVPIQ
jgi:PAS domain-containing protein